MEIFGRRPLTTEELLTLIEEWDDDELDSAESINFTLFPPDQDEDTDLDEASDEVIAENDIHDLGKGILGQTSLVQIVVKNSEKHDLMMKVQIWRY
ncbi:hypothetical protein NQ314_009825 [Rhamnusium bicolor]|uniref:Uncharacterized protein n=1 Tax=Rhamnusium bicolor TaxID=1586634 RepID=A0AAV8XXU0_9CUCU|nr:hypothetical protein NQ314_009825 [Rhamnusium bicolor]